MSTTETTKHNVYAIVTERIVQALKSGTVPWSRPWASMPAPRNFLSNQPYRGVNNLLLRLAERSTPYWLTRKQVELRGGTIRAGERGSVVTFWKAPEPKQAKEVQDTKEPQREDRAILRYYLVWNYDQCEGLPALPEPHNNDRSKCYEDAEVVIRCMPQRPTISRGGDQAYYSVTTDVVNIPATRLFKDLNCYYSVWFHELSHSTRHSSRLDRRARNEDPNKPRVFGDSDYSREELVAELSAAFVCAHVGIENTVPQTAAYLKGWLQALQCDEKLVVHAAAAAQKAADFILNRRTEAKPEEPKEAPAAA